MASDGGRVGDVTVISKQIDSEGNGNRESLPLASLAASRRVTTRAAEECWGLNMENASFLVGGKPETSNVIRIH